MAACAHGARLLARVCGRMWLTHARSRALLSFVQVRGSSRLLSCSVVDRSPSSDRAETADTGNTIEFLTASMDHRIGQWHATIYDKTGGAESKKTKQPEATLEHEYIGHTASVESVAVNPQKTKVPSTHGACVQPL